MNPSIQLAKHLREIHFGGNWTWANMKDNLSDLTWEQATTKIHSFNTIAVLTFHTNYFVDVAISVLEGKPLEAHDKFSFTHPPIHSQEDWQKMLDKVWADAEKLAGLIEQLPEEKWADIFVREKYGNYFRNILGTIEHMHYHLGQIALIKKLILDEKGN